MNQMSVKQYYIPPRMEIISVRVAQNILSNSTESTITNYNLHDLPEE